VKTCREAGIRLVLITGDYGLTAESLARRVGLLTGPAARIVTGAELDTLDDLALERLLTEEVVFARMAPEHKLRLVAALQARGDVVAVTGDGVNDAPALRKSDAGIAMGVTGTDVAKEAADVVLTNDNFAAIVDAVAEGRAVYDNLRKFTTYIFASNVPEVLPFVGTVLFNLPLALTVTQILAIDLVTDLLPALALGAEPPEPGVMDQPPRARRERLLDTRRLLHAYGFLGVAEAICALAAFFWTYWLAGWRPGMPMVATGALYRRATTMTFAGIVATQVGNVFACRTDRESVFRAGFFGNPYVFVGIAAELGLLLVLIVTPPLAGVFGLTPLGVAEWGFLLWMPPTMLLLEEGRKALVRARSARYLTRVPSAS
jgi:magnesium-transporting ATPase (P-type)